MRTRALQQLLLRRHGHFGFALATPVRLISADRTGIGVGFTQLECPRQKLPAPSGLECLLSQIADIRAQNIALALPEISTATPPVDCAPRSHARFPLCPLSARAFDAHGRAPCSWT